MRRLRIPIILLLLAGLLYIGYQWGHRGLVAPGGSVQLDNGARLQWTDCWFDVPLGRVTHCAWFEPSPDHANTAMRLPVVVFRYRGLDRKPSPVLYLAGGPGGGAWLGPEDIAGWYQWLDGIDWPHDFVVFDQRGTGLGAPKPDCPELKALYARLLGEPLPPAEAM
ncbi:MAG TPA: hypothetical protein ENN42_00005, partial [Thioalkalivibrio sp.]|nr:hypothetical protein [Thioalkalivibrio sp.]